MMVVMKMMTRVVIRMEKVMILMKVRVKIRVMMRVWMVVMGAWMCLDAVVDVVHVMIEHTAVYLEVLTRHYGRACHSISAGVIICMGETVSEREIESELDSENDIYTRMETAKNNNR